jgi:hypothetical protein
LGYVFLLLNEIMPFSLRENISKIIVLCDVAVFGDVPLTFLVEMFTYVSLMKTVVDRNVLLGMYPTTVLYEGPLLKTKYMTSQFNIVDSRL